MVWISQKFRQKSIIILRKTLPLSATGEALLSAIYAEYIGGYQDYIDAKSREEKIQTASAPKAVTEPEKVKPKANRTVKLSYKEQRELDALPDEIAVLETEQAEINTQLSDPEIFKDYEKAGALQSRTEEIEMLLLEKLERWEWLEAKQNGEAV